eukprot:TRINITY_DN10236_c0_g1_i2.p1 TRINITY_DN10236_c0_g1~~TRINITY_DN10236_c0_g1_i2.p1  ORF type:complete len:174 (-),score=18.20 TRINITY_DN10236_c0_g1_i2:55-576(-)
MCIRDRNKLNDYGILQMFLSKEVWINDFISLPESYEDFLKMFSGKPCKLCGVVDPNSVMTVCLICGEQFCGVICRNTAARPMRNFVQHIIDQHGACSALVTVPNGNVTLVDKLFILDSFVSLYTDKFGRRAGNRDQFNLVNEDLSKYKLNDENLQKVRDLHFRCLVPDAFINR